MVSWRCLYNSLLKASQNKKSRFYAWESEFGTRVVTRDNVIINGNVITITDSVTTKQQLITVSVGAQFYSIVLLTDTTLLGALVVLWHLRRPNLDVLA